MILTLYDKTHNYVGSIVKKSELKIESQLSGGDKTLSFTYMDGLEVTPECYIRDGQNEYVVKEVDRTTTGFPVIYAALNLEELEGKAWKTFSASDATILEAAQLAIAGTGWTVAGSDVSKRRNAGIVKKSALGVLQDLCTAFMCEISFDTINKAVTFHAQRGSDRGVYFLAGLNLVQLTKKSDSYGFYTRIVPYGADGLDIKSVNSGVEYIDNTQYSTKVRTYIWEDTNYTDAQALKDDATAKLADISKPKVSYSAQVIDLARMSADYSLLDYGLGDTVTLIDKNTGTRDKQRIVKLVEYPEEPNRNTCEMSNTFLTWEEMQAKLQASAAIVDALIGSDGNYNGTIKVSDILHFTDGVVGTSSGSNVTLGNFFQTTTGAIGVLNLEVGRISANMLTAETADLRYANITFGNLDTANINKAKIKDLFVEVGLIKDAVISGAKITGYLDAVEVNAANITAGTLIADRIAIRGSTTSLVYALNNYGQIVSQQTNTLDGYILTERTINANKIVANSITGDEIAANTITAFNIVGTSLSAIYADLGEITAGVLKSQNYSYSSGNYTTTGMIIDLNNKIYRTPNTAILADGSFYTKSGQIGPWTIGSTGIHNGLTSLSGVMNGTYIGTDGIAGAASNGLIRYELTPNGHLALKDNSGNGVIHVGISLDANVGGVFGEYILAISPSGIYGIHIDSNNVERDPLSIDFIKGIATFDTGADTGILKNVYNSTTYNLIRNHNNGNISVSASGGVLYLGYENTTSVQTNCLVYANTAVLATAANGEAYIQARNSGSGNRIYLFANPDGRVGLHSYDSTNTARGILMRSSNSNDITAYGGWEFDSGYIVSRDLTTEAIIWARNSQNGIGLWANPTSGKVGIGSVDANGNSRPILERENNSTGITAKGMWTFSDNVIPWKTSVSGTPVVSVYNDGKRVAVLESASSYELGVTAQFGTSGTTYVKGVFTGSSSDIRLKKNIKKCTVSALPIINSIHMHEFDWKDGRHQFIGVVADELEELDPKLAVGGGYSDDGAMNIKSVDTFYLVGYLLKAIQELSAEVNRLKGALYEESGYTGNRLSLHC